MLKNIFYKLRIPLIILSVLMIIAGSLLCYSYFKSNRKSEGTAKSYTAAVKAADLTTESLTASEFSETTTTTVITSTVISTTSTSTTETSTAAKVTTSADESVIRPDRYVGESPNSALYQENLFIAGDSITLGLKYYGFIPREHSIAGDSVSMWNLEHFSFTVDNEELGLVEAIEKKQPKILYMWLGMNDVNLNLPRKFVKKYREVIDDIRECVPGIIIVVAAITPVSSGCKVVKNSIIRDYNAALMEMVKRTDSPDVLFFDDYSVICDEDLCLTSGYSSGDGMHLYIPCYTEILSALFDFLDTANINTKIQAK